MNSFNTTAVLDESAIKGTSESAAAADAVEDASGPADIGDPETSEAAVWSRFGDGPLPALPKMAAVAGHIGQPWSSGCRRASPRRCPTAS